MRPGTVRVFEFDASAVRRLGAVHVANVHEVHASDRSQPQLNPRFEGPAIRLNIDLCAICALGHFVGETRVAALNLLKREILGEGGRIVAQFSRLITSDNVWKLILRCLVKVFILGSIPRGWVERREATVLAKPLLGLRVAVVSKQSG